MKGSLRLCRRLLSVDNFGVQVFSHALVVVTGTRPVETFSGVEVDATAVRALLIYEFSIISC